MTFPPISSNVQLPRGKTLVRLLNAPPQSLCGSATGDVGYIDGYVQGANSVPYAVFVHLDGRLDMVAIHSVRGIPETELLSIFDLHEEREQGRDG